MRLCAPSVDGNSTIVQSAQWKKVDNKDPPPWQSLSEFEHPIPYSINTPRSIMHLLEENVLSDPESDLAPSQTSDSSGYSEDYSDQDDQSIMLDLSQLQGNVVAFTDREGNKRRFKLLRKLGQSTAGVFRVREVQEKGATQLHESKKKMIIKIPVLEMAHGVTITYQFTYTRRLQKQLFAFIRDGSMQRWLRRIEIKVDPVAIPAEVQDALRSFPPTRLELLEILLSHVDLEPLHALCVQQGLVDTWELSDFGKTALSWVTVCLLNPIHEEAIDLCISPYINEKNPAMPACLSMLSHHEWSPMPEVRVHNCRLMEEAPGTPLRGLAKRIVEARWERERLQDVDKPLMPSFPAEAATLTQAAVDLAYQLDRAGFVQADDRRNYRVVKNTENNSFSHLTCIDGGDIHPIAGHQTSLRQLIRETKVILSRYLNASPLLSGLSLSLLSYWTRPMNDRKAFTTEQRLLEVVRDMDRSWREAGKEPQLGLELAAFRRFDNISTTLRYWTIIQAAVRLSNSVEFPRYVRQTAEEQMFRHGEDSDAWFEAVLGIIYADGQPDCRIRRPSGSEISEILDDHLPQIENHEDDVDMSELLAISMSVATDTKLFAGLVSPNNSSTCIPLLEEEKDPTLATLLL